MFAFTAAARSRPEQMASLIVQDEKDVVIGHELNLSLPSAFMYCGFSIRVNRWLQAPQSLLVF
ncbi:hypothetical protein [Comamonas odontotermitis]|uniref:hypothetical protein n=1 Tax=Comamonas odontotermitis TaxID=379895 RepID=UPI001CC695DF|nr:hypothetical protein [Comamonas odontotermitis]UBB15857.1 hypothetical protein LAD35_13500 [Comamonas odontotermitis]